MSAGLILNRLCEVCHHRFGEHRLHDDACPVPEGNWARGEGVQVFVPRKRTPPRAAKSETP